MERFLKPTKYLDYHSEPVSSLAKSFLQRFPNSDDPAQRRALAVSIHDYVRDNIKFGFGPYFWDHRASDVLKCGLGFCNTQSGLLVALLRACGIPARQHFVSINTLILKGVVSPPVPFVDHSYAEVYLDGKWVKTDSYIVDPELFAVAKKKLLQENAPLGFGLSSAGSNTWDGIHDSFSQFVLDDKFTASTQLSDKDHGIFDDVHHFYSSHDASPTTGGWFIKFIFFLINRSVNSGIEHVRQSQA